MSDVPELDRLLAEEENIRRNKAWDRRDRVFSLFLGCLILLVVLSGPLVFALGELGAVITVILFTACTLPVLVGVVFNLLVELFTPPRPRDPTKRYNYK